MQFKALWHFQEVKMHPKGNCLSLKWFWNVIAWTRESSLANDVKVYII